MIFTRLHHFAACRVGLSAFLLVALVWNAASADVLVLRNGGRIEGTLANKEVVARDPFAFSYVSFLLLPEKRAPELLSFSVAEVEYILLDSDDVPRVIDFQVSRSFPTPQARSTTADEARRRDLGRGIGLIAFGLGIGIFAAVNPFEENWRYVPSASNYATRVNTGNTYNSANYILMGVGALSILSGGILINRDTTPSDESASLWAMPHGAGLRKSWNF